MAHHYRIAGQLIYHLEGSRFILYLHAKVTARPRRELIQWRLGMPGFRDARLPARIVTLHLKQRCGSVGKGSLLGALIHSRRAKALRPCAELEGGSVSSQREHCHSAAVEYACDGSLSPDSFGFNETPFSAWTSESAECGGSLRGLLDSPRRASGEGSTRLAWPRHAWAACCTLKSHKSTKYRMLCP